MRRIIIILLMALISSNISSRNAVHVNNIFDMIFFADDYLPGAPGRDKLRRRAIPDSIAECIRRCDTIDVFYYINFKGDNGLHEVWRYGSSYYEYAIHTSDEKAISVIPTEGKTLMDKIKAGYYKSADDQDIKYFETLTFYRFIRYSPYLYEFERQFYWADLNNGEVYK